MDVFVEREGRTLQLQHAGDARSLLASLGISPDVVLIVKDGMLITEDDRVDDAHRIELLSVISGG